MIVSINLRRRVRRGQDGDHQEGDAVLCDAGGRDRRGGAGARGELSTRACVCVCLTRADDGRGGAGARGELSTRACVCVCVFNQGR